MTEIYDFTMISDCWSSIIFVFVMSLVDRYLHRSLCTKLTSYLTCMLKFGAFTYMYIVMCVNMYIYVCRYVYIYVCIYVHMCVCVYENMYEYIYEYICIYI